MSTLVKVMPRVHVYYCIKGIHYGVTPFDLMRCHMGCPHYTIMCWN